MKYSIKMLSMVLLLCGWCGIACFGGEDPNSVRVMPLTLSPAAEPAPALKYQFSVPLYELRPGNAALQYYNLNIGLESVGKEEWQKISDWCNADWQAIPQEELSKSLAGLQNLFNRLRQGTRYRYCDWQLPVEEGLFMDLPALGNFRQMQRGLALKIRKDVYEGRFEEAIGNLQIGVTFSRQIGQEVMLIQMLVGSSMMWTNLQEMELLISQPNAPNLYWALTLLSSPFFDGQQPIKFEMGGWMGSDFWRELEGLSQHVLTESEAQHLEQKLLGLFRPDIVGETPDAQKWPPIPAKDLVVQARTKLSEWGFNKQTWAAMPVEQLVMWYRYEDYKRVRDDHFKWTMLSYEEWNKRKSLPGYNPKGSFADLPDSRYKENPFLLLFPSLDKCYHQQMRLDRDIRALRCVEAIRMYMAGHAGQLPKTLADIKQVTLPDDPIASKPFKYELRGQEAILESLPIPDINKSGLRYEIKVRAK